MRPIFTASVALSLALLAGRVSGLLREYYLAAVFGVSPVADQAVLLLTLPDLLVNLLISGGLSAALVPRFSVLAPQKAMALFRRISLIVLLVFGCAGVLLVTWPQSLFGLLAPGTAQPFNGGQGGLFAVAVALPLSGIAGVAGAYLNANQRYFTVACGTLLFNAGVIVALTFARSAVAPLGLLALGIAGGAALRWLAQMAILPRQVWTAKSDGKLFDLPLIKSFALAASAAALVMLAPIIVRAMASTIGPGAIASFNYAQKLVELPVTILVTSISTVALTRLSMLYASNLHADASRSAVRDTQYAVLVSVAVLVFGFWFVDSVVRTIFSGTSMDAGALQRVATLTALAMLGIPFVAISSMATACLNASGRTSHVFRVTAVTLMILPVFALPGLLISSEAALMLAVVGFQVVSAVWLARLAGLRLWFGADSVFGSSTLPHFGAVVGLAAVCVGADWVLNPAHDGHRMLLAGTGFLVAMLLPVRSFLRSSVQPQSLITP